MKVAIIPARGGSKRIPRKNIKLFFGLPIIAYSIKAAQESNLFDRIIVSTDDPEIAQISKQYGAEIPFLRPAKLSDDFATTGEVISHAIEELQKEGEKIDLVCCIYATAPFIQIRDLKESYQLLVNNDADFAFSATSFPFPIQRAIKLNERNQVEMFQPENLLTRSQDLEEAYHDAGQFYWGKAEAYLENKPVFSPQSCAILLPRERVQDIDTPEDWKRAEIMFQVLEKDVTIKK
tara:strand:+ start:5573 stop:6277 length:705 start_codon:yes stop_codon:yes gene_type:complete